MITAIVHEQGWFRTTAPGSRFVTLMLTRPRALSPPFAAAPGGL